MGTPEYLSMMRLRKIWDESSFSAMKRERCLSKIRKRGISATTEECLLSAIALNLRRMAKVIFWGCFSSRPELRMKSSGPGFAFVNKSLILSHQISKCHVLFKSTWHFIGFYCIFSYPVYLQKTPGDLTFTNLFAYDENIRIAVIYFFNAFCVEFSQFNFQTYQPKCKLLVLKH